MSTGNQEGDKKTRSGHLKIVDMVLRAGHIVAMSVLFGGAFWQVPFSRLMLWHNLTIATGVCLVAVALYKSRHWPYQLSGVAAEVHIALLAVIHLRRDLMVPVLIPVLLIGVVGSHMPGKVRHWSVIHRRRID